MPIEQLAAYNKPDREKVLYAGAKPEGKITWYTSLAGDSYKDLAAAFEARYPGVKVESYRATRQEMSARIMAEAQSKRYIADTLETTIPLLEASEREPDAGSILFSDSGEVSGQRQRESAQRVWFSGPSTGNRTSASPITRI